MLLNCDVGEDSWESLGLKGNQTSQSRGNQSWISIGRTDAEAEAPTPWLSDVKNWLTGKDPDPGKDWTQEEKGMTEDEMVGWYHWLNGHEFEQASGVGDGQGSLACCSPWGCKESDSTEWLNWDPQVQPSTHPWLPKCCQPSWKHGEFSWGSCSHFPQNDLKKLVWEDPQWNKPLVNIATTSTHTYIHTHTHMHTRTHTLWRL